MREQRKVVTVLFCDLVGSTALGESNDPEVVRARLARTFQNLRTILERHGGSVEKFVGDAVMAVFGIPAAHEDDALRAVRAASEMRAAIVSHGLEARIGVNTGEVVVGGESETLVTGDAVNVAARLEQAAGAGEILIGSDTRVLVRDAVVVDAVEPLTLKGKAEPVEAFRLVEVSGEAAPLARHLDTPLVGRVRERQRLWRDYEDAVADRTCHLFTLLGPAGIGKSRLVADFLERVGDTADILRGRCLSYGEGITYWPLVEILIALGVEPDTVIGTSPPETQLAFRRLLEARAVERPQVVVIDDLQWAEPVFVELVEHVADLSRDAPIFLLCVARTELLDARPDWGGGKLNATSLHLEPLGADECAELMTRLAHDTGLDSDLRNRITAASAGNPLYVEEMLAMVREHGGGDVVVPPTIHALLQARIDSLDSDVRVVMERGAVEGEVFHRGAVAELSPEPVRNGVETHLATLVRKELIRSTPPTFPTDEGFRFRHLLIRDAAYDSLPKATRAELHERFADWLSRHELVEGDEIVGYHLERAYRYRHELDSLDPALADLAGRASRHLARAGRGALDHGDFTASRSLFRRASALLSHDEEARLALAPDYAEALVESDADEAWELLVEAQGSSDRHTRARVAVSMATGALDRSGGAFEERESWRREARATFEELGDEYGLAQCWFSTAWEAWAKLRATEAAEAYERALMHLDRVGERGARLRGNTQARLTGCYYHGPMPVDEALRRIEALPSDGHGLADAWQRVNVARLLAMHGACDRAQAMWRDARQLYLDAGLMMTAASFSLGGSEIAFRAGDADTEQELLREALGVLEAVGDRGFFSTVAVALAECLCRAGATDDEIEGICARARERTSDDDLVNLVWLDLIAGLLASRRGEHDSAELLSRRSVERADSGEFHLARVHSRAARAEILAASGRASEAASVATVTLGLCASKGDVAGAARFSSHLASVGVALP